MASRAPERIFEDISEKYNSPSVNSIADSLSHLGISSDTLALSLSESLAERYLSAAADYTKSSGTPVSTSRLLFGGGCGVPRRDPLEDPSNLQLFSNDFMNYLNQIA